MCSWDSTLELFVAPTGSGTNPGTKARPFATLQQARDAVRGRKASDTLPAGGVTVWLRGGTYTLTSSFVLTADDAGRADAPITYRAYSNETVCLRGGTAVSAWTPVTDQAVLSRLPANAREHVVQTDLTAHGITDFGKLLPRGYGRPVQPAHLQLIFQGHTMELARWPNDDFVTISGFPETGFDSGHGPTVGTLEEGFYFANDRPTRWAHPEEAWIHGYWVYDWANSYEQIASVDPDTHLIKTRPPHGVYGFKAMQRIYFLNILEELDLAGEYYVDKQTGLLYFWPPAPLQGAETVVTQLERPLITLEQASYVHLCNLTLECTRGDGIVITGGAGNLVAGCTLRQLGNRGVAVDGGTGHQVTGCDVYDTGDCGITLDGGDRATLTPGGHVANNNHVHHIANWSKCYQPGINVDGVGHRVAHNVIHDTPHNGILMLDGNDNIFEFNELYRTCLETGDVGAFYMGYDYSEQGNIVRHNYFHHIGGMGLGSMAVYLDDCASGTTVTGNIFYRTQRAALIGGGRDNVVDNNVFIECMPSVTIDGRGLDTLPVWRGMVGDLQERLEEMNYHQPPYSTRYPRLAEIDKYFVEGNGVPPEGNAVTHNISVGGQWLDIGWHAAPEKIDLRNNLVDEDPQFINQALMNFQLRDDSPAYKLGFQRIPVEKIGLYQDDNRRSVFTPAVECTLEVLARPVIGDMQVTPGRACLKIVNFGNKPAKGHITLHATPAAGVSFSTGTKLPYRLQPGKETIIPATFDVPAEATTVSLFTTCADPTVLAASAKVEMEREVTFSRLPAMTDVREITTALANQRQRAVMWNGMKVADVRAAIAGTDLAVWATVYDQRVTPGAADWNGTNIDVLVSLPGAAPVRQLVLIPKGPQKTGETLFVQNNNARENIPLDASRVRWTAISREDAGYDIMVLLPLSDVNVDPAQPFLFETAVMTAPMKNTASQYVTLFGSIGAYYNSSKFSPVQVETL